MTFGEALEALNDGAFVARKGWNSKGIFIYKVEASEPTYDKLRGRCKDALNYVYKHVKDDEPKTVQNTVRINAHIGMQAADDSQTVQETVRVNAHIDMKAADGSIVVGWLASQTDMLADDWYIVKEAE